MVDDLGRHRSQEHRSDRPEPPTSDDDQTGSEVGRLLDDHAGGAAVEESRLDHAARAREDRGRIGEAGLERRGDLPLFVLGAVVRDDPDQDGRHGLDHRHHADDRGLGPGE